MLDDFTLSTNKELRIVKRVAKKAAITPNTYPLIYVVSAFIANQRPTITKILSVISFQLIFRLKNKGSKSAENKEDVAIQTTATDTLDTLMLSKKNSQWAATTTPMPKILTKLILETSLRFFLMSPKKSKIIKANNILYQTRTEDSNSMSFPRIPVKPKITTIKCIIKRLYLSENFVIFVLYNKPQSNTIAS
jgi:hypothetical protein